jgi:leader peptidase (prepilin peptidase)/N-methyltransferase
MIEALVGALFGLVIGSFLNVCIHRLPRDLSLVAPRSRCPRCDRPIAWYDNIPALSYAILAGRCRHCRAWISPRYPLVELAAAALLAAIAARWGFTIEALKWASFTSMMLALAFTDLETRILPDEMTKGGLWLGLVLSLLAPVEPGLVSFVLANVAEPVRSLAESLFAAGFLSGTLWVVGALYARLRGREGLGFGDVKLIAMMGAFLGFGKAFLALVAGSVAGSVVGLIFVIATRKDARTYEVPFGTFLAVAAIAAVYWS